MVNPITVEVLPASAVDFQLLHALLDHAFADSSGSAPHIPGQEALRRKYDTPSGTSYVAVVRDGGDYVAVNGALHIRLEGPGGTFDSWMSCDTATRATHRGRGLFMACIQALQRDLPDSPVFFGFPNLASIGGFRKIGWTEQHVLPIWATWTGLGGAITPQRYVRNGVAGRLSPPLVFGIEKSPAYLEWRYPVDDSTYSRVSGYQSGKEFALNARRMQLSGLSATVVLETQYTTASGFAQALSAARRLARGFGDRVLVASPGRGEARLLLERGFVQVPQRMNPRPVRFMGIGLGAASGHVWGAPWSLSLGDWDAL